MSLEDLDYAAADPQRMLGAVEATPDQWRAAHEIAQPLAAAAQLRDARPAAVVVAGMGGSGIAGDVAALLAHVHGTVPVVPSKGYRLPAWVGPQTLVVAVSYSGNTEETLAAVEHADAAGATVAAVTSGGALGERAAHRGWPTAVVPGGRQPRASLGYLATPTLGALAGAGVLPGGVLEEAATLADRTAALVKDWRRDVPTEHNAAKDAAARLHGLVPVFHGGRGVGALVALRARCQVNENASRPAFANELPELDHNEVVGWDAPAALTDRFGLVRILDAEEEHPQIRTRFEATRAVAGDAFPEIVDHHLGGGAPLQRLAAGILFVDFVSVYLALLAGVDPTPVAPIDELKQRVAAAARPDGG